MQLNKTQISRIDNDLEKFGVAYIDYKFEILDHIASEVENTMEEKYVNFEEALSIVLEKWNPKFKKSYSPLFGLIWVLPEILMQKAKKMYWKKMLKLLIAAAIFTPILLFFKDYFSKKPSFIFYLICTILVLQFMGYIAIRMSRYKTTFGFLYKQQFLAFIALYLISLNILNSNTQIFERPVERVFPVFFMISLLTIASIVSFTFFKEHFKALKRNNKFI